MPNPLRSKFVRNVSVLMSGTLMAQVISFAVMPFLSRLFTPADFGILGLVNSVAAVGTGIAAMRYDMAVLLPKEDDEGANVFAVGFAFTFVTGLSCLLIVAFFRGHIAALFDKEEVADWLWVAPAIMVPTGLYNVFRYWCTRKKLFSHLSLAAFLAAGSSAGAKSTAGVMSLGAGGLIFGQVFGQIVAMLILVIQTLRDDYQTFHSSISLAKMKAALGAYREFPIFHAPQTLLNSLTQHVPIFLLAKFFLTEEVGYFNMTLTVLAAPVFLLSDAVRQVFMQRATEILNAGNSLVPILIKAVGTLFAIGILPAILGMFISPWLFETIFGEQWRTSGIYAQVMIPWQLSVLFAVPCVAAFPILRMQRWVLGWQIITNISSTAVLFVLCQRGTPLWAVGGYSAVMTLSNLVLIVLVLVRARRHVATPDTDDKEDV